MRHLHSAMIIISGLLLGAACAQLVLSEFTDIGRRHLVRYDNQSVQRMGVVEAVQDNAMLVRAVSHYPDGADQMLSIVVASGTLPQVGGLVTFTASRNPGRLTANGMVVPHHQP